MNCTKMTSNINVGNDSIQLLHSLVLNCSGQNTWTLSGDALDISDFLKVPCVSKTRCVPPRNISHDTILQLNDDDEENAQYSCQEPNLLNFPSLTYPNTVTATCRANHIFNNTLPFWDFEGVKYPNWIGRNLCLSPSVCYGKVPKLPKHLTRKI